MHYVYILRSEHGAHMYYGSTSNLARRINSHNSGQSPHTKKYRPWVIVWYGCFTAKKQAEDFEKYLKTASGKAFARKRLLIT